MEEEQKLHHLTGIGHLHETCTFSTGTTRATSKWYICLNPSAFHDEGTVPSKCRETQTQRHYVTFQKTWTLSSIAKETANLAYDISTQQRHQMAVQIIL
jgi:hypothetical protein